jgi:hypothetical protein
VWRLPEGCNEDGTGSLAVAALQSCSLQEQQDFLTDGGTGTPEGCNPASPKSDVQPSGAAFFQRDEF